MFFNFIDNFTWVCMTTIEASNGKEHPVTAILRRFLSPWGRLGFVRGSFGGHFRSFGGRSGAVRGSFVGHSGVDGGCSGSFQGHSGVVRDLFGGRSAVVQGSFETFFEKFSKKIRNLFC